MSRERSTGCAEKSEERRREIWRKREAWERRWKRRGKKEPCTLWERRGREKMEKEVRRRWMGGG